MGIIWRVWINNIDCFLTMEFWCQSLTVVESWTTLKSCATYAIIGYHYRTPLNFSIVVLHCSYINNSAHIHNLSYRKIINDSNYNTKFRYVLTKLQGENACLWMCSLVACGASPIPRHLQAESMTSYLRKPNHDVVYLPTLIMLHQSWTLTRVHTFFALYRPIIKVMFHGCKSMELVLSHQCGFHFFSSGIWWDIVTSFRLRKLM